MFYNRNRKPDELIFRLEILANQFIEDNHILVLSTFKILSDKDTKLIGEEDENEILKIEKVFNAPDSLKCKIETTMEI